MTLRIPSDLVAAVRTAINARAREFEVTYQQTDPKHVGNSAIKEWTSMAQRLHQLAESLK